jgi:hypothetical protein
MGHIALAVGLCLVVLAATTPGTGAADEIRKERVHFAAGRSGTTIRDRIEGRESVSYLVGAEAGQRMQIRLTSANDATCFNLYAPRSGPGDEALAMGEMTTPEINTFDGILPASGDYTISVFLYRNAARRGEASDFTLDLSITGARAAKVQTDFADGLAGGPDFFSVRVLGSPLNLRSAPSSGAGVVARLPDGTVVRNLGCRINEGRRWCHVATQGDPGDEGWAAGDFIESGGPGVATQLPDRVPVSGGEDALVPGTGFHATR